MRFKDFKKELERKKEQEETMRELNGAIAKLKAKRDGYVKAAKDALKDDNMSQYNAMVALLKNAIFNLKQAQDMVANFTIARDMCEMQTLNKHFVKSLNNVMSNVYKTCKEIHVSNSEKMFMKALYKQNQTSVELQQALQANNIAFASSVSSISDIDDSEIKELLGDVLTEHSDIDDSLDALEAQFLNKQNQQKNDAPTSVYVTAMDGMPDVKPVHFAGNSAQNDGTNAIYDNRKAEIPVSPEVKPVSSAEKPEKPEEDKRNEVQRNSSNGEVKEEKQEPMKRPEDEILGGVGEGGFVWDNIPSVGFDDIAGLEDVKNVVKVKVLLPLKNPEAFEGYEKKNGGGLCLFGPPGTGKTMIAAAIAKEIGAKFCSVKPSDLLQQGAGNTEKAVRSLFQQARKFSCAVIYFDEMDSISPKSTKSQYAKQLRSEFLAQLQGVESYKKDSGNILFLICATNKPWEIDSAFLRPGRFGTKIYVGLPDESARRYIIEKRIAKIKEKGKVSVKDDIDIENAVAMTNGFNGSDMTNLLDRIEELSILRGIETGEKCIRNEDLVRALEEVHSSVQVEDLVKLNEWRVENDK